MHVILPTGELYSKKAPPRLAKDLDKTWSLRGRTYPSTN